MSSDAWRVAVNLDTNVYEEAISAIRTDLRLIEERKTEFTPVLELKQVAPLLDALELKLHDFQQVLPRRDRRRGLLNLGGTILKSLFGTATINDLHVLRNTLDSLQTSTSDIVHSLTNQITYVKKLDIMMRVSACAIANLSSTVKVIVNQSYEKFQQTARNVIWFNYTLHGQSELFTAVRQVEFALLQMIQQVIDLISAVQSVLQGKLPMNLINPTTLQDILRNVSTHLPEGYELLASPRSDTIYLYYELVSVVLIGNSHGIKIIVNVPLKTTDQHFTLYKIIVLPSRVSGYTFAWYSADYSYVGLSPSNRDYILITETYLRRCIINSITLCPADIALYITHIKSCELSLIFQANISNTMCRRDLLYNYRTPILQQHGKVWLYHFPERRPVTIRSPQANGWITHTASLAEVGKIFNASYCSIITNDIWTSPELHGDMQEDIDNTKFYIPDQPSIVADHEIPFIRETSQEEIARLDEIKSKVVVPPQTFDIDSLFNTRRTSLRQAQQTYWHLTVTSTACTIALFSVLYFLHSLFRASL